MGNQFTQALILLLIYFCAPIKYREHPFWGFVIKYLCPILSFILFLLVLIYNFLNFLKDIT